MSDIADKIYAATGLTLGAEAAAAIGQMIQVENEKLRAKQADRIAGLEAALQYTFEYVGRLAVTLAEKHYPDQRFELLPNLLGRIDQIDNMTCGLTRAALAGGKS